MRDGCVGGGRRSRGGAGLKTAGTTTALLRSALEAAVAVAREGERTAPAVAAPGPLRRYLSFARLPDPALEVAKRVLDDDEVFRARVAAAVDEETVGRAGWLFLARPPGWEPELDGLRKAAAARQIAAKEERAERDALRRLAGAEAAAARAEAAAVTSSAEADRLRVELQQERASAQATAVEVERLRAELADALEDRRTAIRRVKEAEATVGERTAEVRALRHELRMVQAELAAEGSPVSGSTAASEPSAADAVDHAALVIAVSDAHRALLDLTAAISTASDLLVPPTPVRPEGRRPGRRRQPAGLPPGIRDDSPEAAEHLVRNPGALMLVDGYNISHAQWYGRPLTEQRSRLLAACAELHARCGTDIEVVFDGDSGGEDEAGAAGTVRTTGPRGGVRYRFSAGRSADDVLLERVDEEPPARPVIVVSSDRAVRDGARQRGANVLGARQVLSVLRR